METTYTLETFNNSIAFTIINNEIVITIKNKNNFFGNTFLEDYPGPYNNFDAIKIFINNLEEKLKTLTGNIQLFLESYYGSLSLIIIFHEKTGHFTLNATILDKKHIQYIMTTTLTIKDEGDQTQLTNFLKDLRSFNKNISINT